MLRVDALQVPLSRNGNKYAIILQDYSTKGAEVFPAAADQKVETLKIVHRFMEHTCHGIPLMIPSL